jgi:dynein heavy chain
MTSSEGEAFSFRSIVPVEGPVEVWMTAVEAEMRRTLAAEMKEGELWSFTGWPKGPCMQMTLAPVHQQLPQSGACRSRVFRHSSEHPTPPSLPPCPGVYNYAQVPRSKWIMDCLGMVTLAGSQVWWTWETEDSFRQVREGDKHAMKTHAAKVNKQLGDLTGMVSVTPSVAHATERLCQVMAGNRRSDALQGVSADMLCWHCNTA